MNSSETEKRDIWVLIPAYNEEKKIFQVVADLQRYGYANVLVVNDGSKDQTSGQAKSAGAEVLEHVMNRGQGAALRTGIEYIADIYGPTAIVTFDADGQHQPEDIEKLVRPIFKNEADIVFGSRFLDGKTRVPILRRIVLKLGVLFTNTVSNVRLTDTHNGLRAMGRKAYSSIEIVHRGMEHASDIIDNITPKQLRYQEVPVTIIYSDYSRQKGQRTSNFIKIGIKVILKKLLQ
jgi:glycosyltransferase involved in cell wall biosynthesis